MRNPVIPLILLAALSGCDIVNSPKEGPAAPIGPGGGTVTRNVLLEDCTGFRCNNCPDAAERAALLDSIYGDRLVVVGVHMLASFAAPQPPNYITDFRTPAGDEYANIFDIHALPTGLVNRKLHNGSWLVSRYSWSTVTAGMIDESADIDLSINTLSFDAGSNTVSGTVRGVLLHPFAVPHNLTLYLTEDHVIDWQTNSQVTPPDVPNYDHRHVFSYPLPSNVLQPDNCALVAYVYSTTGTDRYEVKQVTERKFTP